MLNNLFFNFIKKNSNIWQLVVIITEKCGNNKMWWEKSQNEENFYRGKPYKMKFKKNVKNSNQID